MTTAMFLYMTGILWWILAAVVFTVVFDSKDDLSIRLFGRFILFFIFVGAVHFTIAWLINIGTLPAGWNLWPAEWVSNPSLINIYHIRVFTI